MDLTLWYPRTSVAETGEDEKHTDNSTNDEPHRKHKRRKPNRIERRYGATVDVGARNDSPTENNPAGYATIEDSSFVGLEKFENWKECEQTSCISGWRNEENVARMVLHRPYYSSSIVINDRGTLQSREVSDRLYSSRLNTQMSKRREKYRFTHANNPKEHVQNYNESCGYSHLMFCSHKRPKTLAAKEEDKMVTGEKTSKEKEAVILPKTVTSATRTKYNNNRPKLKHSSSIPPIPFVTNISNTTDRVLHALADRLGVKESIDEPKLLCSPVRPTPPSITKGKSEIREDLVLLPEKKSNEISSPKSNTQTSNPSQSRPATKLSKERRTPHQLPKIHRKKPSTSSISLSKYFHINTKNNINNHNRHEETFETEEGEDTVPVCSRSSSLLSFISSESIEKELPDHELWPRFVATDRPTALIAQKEEVIRRKADSLGLLSHKWAKNFIERGFMTGSIPRKLYYDYSRQQSTAETATKTKTITRATTTLTTTRNRVQQQSLLTKQNEKLQELRELYANGRKSRISSSIKKDNKSENKIIAHSNDHHRSNKSRQQVTRPPTRAKSVINRRNTTRSRSHEMCDSQDHRQNRVKVLPPNKPGEFELQGLTQRISTKC